MQYRHFRSMHARHTTRPHSPYPDHAHPAPEPESRPRHADTHLPQGHNQPYHPYARNAPAHSIVPSQVLHQHTHRTCTVALPYAPHTTAASIHRRHSTSTARLHDAHTSQNTNHIHIPYVRNASRPLTSKRKPLLHLHSYTPHTHSLARTLAPLITITSLLRFPTEQPTHPPPSQYVQKPGDEYLEGVLAVVPPQDFAGIIPKENLLHAYAQAAAYCDVDELPTKGIKSYSASGPYDIFSNYRDVCLIRDSEDCKMTVTQEDGSKVVCDLYSHRVDYRPNLGAQFTREFVDFHSAHGISVLKTREHHTFIWPYAIREALERAGFLVLRCDRPSLKVDGSSLGNAGAGSIIHFNFRPTDLSLPLDQTIWPPFLLPIINGTPQPLTYQLAEHDKLSGKVCLKDAPCHLYFRNPPEGQETCVCDKMDRLAADRAASTGGGSSYAKVRAKFAVEKGSLPCRHLVQGKCNLATCKFYHSKEALDAAGKVNCQLMRNSKSCKAGIKCPYKHPWDIPEDVMATTQCMYIPYNMHPDLCNT